MIYPNFAPYISDIKSPLQQVTLPRQTLLVESDSERSLAKGRNRPRLCKNVFEPARGSESEQKTRSYANFRSAD